MKLFLIILIFTMSGCIFEYFYYTLNPDHLVEVSKDAVHKSQKYSNCSTGKVKEAWDESNEIWNKVLIMAQKSKKGMSDPNWDSKLWEKAHDTWNKAFDVSEKNSTESGDCVPV